jgi:hypothetical protein
VLPKEFKTFKELTFESMSVLDFVGDSWEAPAMIGSRLGTMNPLKAKTICNLKYEISSQAKRGGSWEEPDLRSFSCPTEEAMGWMVARWNLGKILAFTNCPS